MNLDLVIILILSAIALLTIRNFFSEWLDLSAKFFYNLLSVILFILLLSSLLPLPWKVEEHRLQAKYLFVLIDISASLAGLDNNKLTQQLSDKFSNHNIKATSFSDTIPGKKDALHSNIANSFEFVLSNIKKNFDKDSLAGIILISDGNETENLQKLNSLSERNFDTPVHILYIDKEENKEKSKKRKPTKIIPDRSVHILDLPEFLSLYDKHYVHFSVTVAGQRLKEIPVKIFLNNKKIGSKLIKLKNGYGEGKYPLLLREHNSSLLRLEVDPADGERNISNNTTFKKIEGFYKNYRILHIAGYPSVNTAFVRRGLQNIPGVDLISFFILRSPEQVIHSPQSELSLILFPTDQLFRQELDNFDVIIMNDFSINKFLNSRYILNIENYVRKGGALIYFGGPKSFILNNHNLYFPEQLFPIRRSLKKNYERKNFRVRSTAEAIHSPVLPFFSSYLFTQGESSHNRNSPNKNRLQGLNRVKFLREIKTLLQTDQGEPLLISNKFGQGSALIMLSDSFWQLSYQKRIPPQDIIHSFIRHSLHFRNSPLIINQDNIVFDPFYQKAFASIQDYNSLEFVLESRDFSNNLIFKKRIDAASLVQQKESILSTNAHERKHQEQVLALVLKDKDGKKYWEEKKYFQNKIGKNEFQNLPLGEKVFQAIAENSDGSFTRSSLQNLTQDLDKLPIKDQNYRIKTVYRESSILNDPRILLLMLFLMLATFYLKSRYMK